MLLARRSLVKYAGLSCLVGCSGDPEPNETGAKALRFELEDFQPQSPRFGERYGTEEFQGSVLLMPLFAGWCADCVGCARLLEERYAEWLEEGLNVRVMSINSIDAEESQKPLIEACSFPLLQDTPAQKIWERLLGGRDDHYIYTPELVLDRYYDYSAGERVDPLTIDGKAALREALVAAGA
jgi:hypothetical protein